MFLRLWVRAPRMTICPAGGWRFGSGMRIVAAPPQHTPLSPGLYGQDDRHGKALHGDGNRPF